LNPVRALLKASMVVGFGLLAFTAYVGALYAFDWNHAVGVGSVWSYRVSTPSGFVYEEAERLMGLELCGTRICGIYEAKAPRGTSLQWRTSDWELLRSLFVDPVGDARDLVYDVGLPLYRFPLQVGENWSWETGGTRTTTIHVQGGHIGTVSKRERVLVSGITREVMREEPVEVPAGSFRCFVIDQFDENRMIMQRIWFNAEAGGAVKYIAGFGGVYHTTWELTRYNIVGHGPSEFLKTKVFFVEVGLLLAAGAVLAVMPVALQRLQKSARPVEGRPTQ